MCAVFPKFAKEFTRTEAWRRSPACRVLEILAGGTPTLLFSNCNGLNESGQRRHSTPMAVKVFAREQPASAPTAANPNIAVLVVSPVASHPNCVRVRTRRPVASRPIPVTAPFPAARNPEPNVQRPGRDRHNFDLRWRRILRLGHNDLGGRRRDRDRLTFKDHAAREQRQADGQQKAFGQNRFFHNHLFDSSTVEFVTGLISAIFRPVPPAAPASAGRV